MAFESASLTLTTPPPEPVDEALHNIVTRRVAKQTTWPTHADKLVVPSSTLGGEVDNQPLIARAGGGDVDTLRTQLMHAGDGLRPHGRGERDVGAVNGF